MTFASRTGIMKRETLTDRENQLNLLHQEILMQREALLHVSGSHLRHQLRSPASTGTIPAADASIRNARLLKDMETLNQELKEHLNSAPSPRFVTLQSNYWSMVRSLLPLWEQSFSGKQYKHRQHQQQSSHHQCQQQPHKMSGKSTLQARATK